MLRKLVLPTLLMFVAIRGATGQCSADILFVVDETSSISSSWFDLAKHFMRDFLHCFADPDDALVFELLSYSMPLRTSDVRFFDSAIRPIYSFDGLLKEGGLSPIGLAIRYMQVATHFRDGVPRGAIVLTDGQSEGPAQTMDDYEAEAAMARAAGIVLYAVIVGDFVDSAALGSIVGGSDGVFNSNNPCNLADRILADLCNITGCPDDSPMVYCFADPCTVTACPATPDATCVSDYCGGCNANFFDTDGGLACCGGHGQPCETDLPIARPGLCMCQGGLLCFPNTGNFAIGTCQTQEWVDANGGMPAIRG